jgi:RNA exonuclease 4
MDVKAGLSSNWAALQARLREEKRSLGRKSVRGTSHEATNGVSKHRSHAKKKTNPKPSPKTSSSQPQKQQPSTTLQAPAPSQASASAATRRPADLPNGGLTPHAFAGKYVALDCEMVGVGPRPEATSMLARASVVDFHGTQLYDSFVLPTETVTDYRTSVSGITPELVRHGGGARSFETVQSEVAELLLGRILVGHAVQNDLRALLLTHPASLIRDTSELKKYREVVGGRRPKLRDLAKLVLGVDIQAGSHSSVEDARITMALFRREKAAFEVGRAEDAQARAVRARLGRRKTDPFVKVKKKTGK